LEFSHLDGQCFQIFLDNLAAEYPEHLNVVQLDNGKFHPSSQLKIPSGCFTGFSTTIQSRIESERESMAIYKTRIELEYDNLDEITEKVRSFLEEFSSETIPSRGGIIFYQH
jgi:hypothetical protein